MPIHHKFIYNYQIMDVMWPVRQLGIYYILERGCYMPNAFYGHSITMQLKGAVSPSAHLFCA